MTTERDVCACGENAASGLTFNQWLLIGLAGCVALCVPHALIRFVEWRIDVHSRDWRFDDEEER